MHCLNKSWMDLQLESVHFQALSITSTVHLGVSESIAWADFEGDLQERVSMFNPPTQEASQQTIACSSERLQPLFYFAVAELDPVQLSPLCEWWKVTRGPVSLQSVQCSSGTICWLEDGKGLSFSLIKHCDFVYKWRLVSISVNREQQKK